MLERLARIADQGKLMRMKMTNEKRLIDANALMDSFREYMVERYDREKCVAEENCKTCENPCLWRKKVSAAHTVDAVEVVRCKDCKMYGNDEECPLLSMMQYTEETDFCSYGERKDE